jgi:signal transduction histidine kinase
MSGSTNDLNRVLHIAGWMWLLYLGILRVIDWFLYSSDAFFALGTYYLVNAGIALVFLAFSYWTWIQQKLKELFIPLMLVIIAGCSITVDQILIPQIPLRPLINLEGLALRLLPILLIGLVIVAWHYPWPVIVLYSLGTAALEIFLLFLNPQPHVEPQVFVTTIQSVSFLVVGFFISRLIQLLHKQQEDLEITNARLVNHASTVEQLTLSRERNRLARELHDTLAHSLSALSVQLETAKAYWDVEPETSQQLLDQSLAATRTGLNDTRRALKALRASPLDDLGLLLALRKLAQTAAERSQFALQLSLPDHIPPLASDVEQCIYRVAQEALENAVHHAHARELSLALAAGTDGITLTIADDGVGFDPQRVEHNSHFGLAGMRERAAMVGAALEVHSRPHGGTRIKLTLKEPRHAD